MEKSIIGQRVREQLGVVDFRARRKEKDVVEHRRLARLGGGFHLDADVSIAVGIGAVKLQHGGLVDQKCLSAGVALDLGDDLSVGHGPRGRRETRDTRCAVET